MVRVHEIKVGIQTQAYPGLEIRVPELRAVPAHVRDFDALFSEPNDVTFEHGKPFALRALLTVLEQKLIADTNAEKGFVLLNPFKNGFNKPKTSQFLHAIAKSALPGKEEV